MVKFSPPPNWEPPGADAQDSEGYMEGIVRYKLENGQVCLYEFEGQPLKDTGESQPTDEQEQEPVPDARAQMQGMMGESNY